MFIYRKALLSLMPQGDLKYHPGISRQDTNARVVPYFLGTLQERSGDYRPIDPLQYRDSVVGFLSERYVPVTTSKTSLKFRVGASPQPSIDLTNRVIFLARKIAVTTREKKASSYLGASREVTPQEYLDHTLGFLGEFRSEEIIDVANKVSLILTADPDHSITPFLVTQGFGRMAKWYKQQEGEGNPFFKRTLDGLDKTIGVCENASGVAHTPEMRVAAARNLLSTLQIPFNSPN
jgi:hypothetical protein